MQTRCKFKCTHVEKTGTEGSDQNAFFEVVVQGSPENESFFRWTPSGRLSLSTVRGGQFEVGQEYYLDITLAD
jgi:hypothetical protein